jgi:hypothetical protein
MILREVRNTLKILEAATAGQLSAELSARRSEVEAALEFWMHRGDVRICDEAAGSVCGTTCKRCPIGSLPKAKTRAVGAEASRFAARRGPRGTTAPVVYEWVSN